MSDRKNWTINEHERHVYIEDKSGVFARFYGPDRSRLAKLFVKALAEQQSQEESRRHGE